MIQEVEGNKTISNSTVQNYCKCFKDEDLLLKIKPKSGRLNAVDYDAMKCKVEVNPITKLSEELLLNIRYCKYVLTNPSAQAGCDTKSIFFK